MIDQSHANTIQPATMLQDVLADGCIREKADKGMSDDTEHVYRNFVFIGLKSYVQSMRCIHHAVGCDCSVGEPASVPEPQWDASPHLHQVLGPDSPVNRPIETKPDFLPGLDEAHSGEFFQVMGKRRRDTDPSRFANCVLLYRSFHSLSHSHYGAVLFERHLVHERSHEVKSAPVSEKQPLRFGRIEDSTAIKAFSFIPHHNRYFSIHAASAAQMNLLVGIFTVSMSHSVGKSFEYGDFNFIFSLFCDAKFQREQFNEPH